MMLRSFVAACFAIVATLLTPPNVFAQTSTTGNVVVDGAVIWRADVTVPAATARLGTALEVTARSSRYYEVIIPASLGGYGERGIIARSQVRIAGDREALAHARVSADVGEDVIVRQDRVAFDRHVENARSDRLCAVVNRALAGSIEVNAR